MSSSNDSNPNPAFHPRPSTVQELIASQTVGLVELSDFRKRRAEAYDQKDREAHDRSLAGARNGPGEGGSGASTPQTGGSDSPAPVKKRKKVGKKKTSTLSFAQNEDDDEANPSDSTLGAIASPALGLSPSASASPVPPSSNTLPARRLGPNAQLAPGTAPKVQTAAVQRREAAARETLRQEFLARQKAAKESVIAIPFVFHDGTSVAGGVCKVRKGEQVWVFLERARKVGAERDGMSASGKGGKGGEREKQKALREWARVGVDDLMVVRGGVIIPHHYEFYYFIVNKTLGPKNVVLFDYSAEPPSTYDPLAPTSDSAEIKGGISTIEDRREEKSRLEAKSRRKAEVDVESMEGSDADPHFTKVVDRRWYERNKHIFPASTWEDFDPTKDYQTAVRRDAGGNAFFFS
ncbi:MAG: hypothetical protein M1814_006106 [Vezdaea aestivalis]|nr:MAG: hypothetical protein M1814_006106 [Vezdaea aestivalis]